MNFYNCLFFLTVVLGLGYYFIRKRYSYWKDENIPYIQPIFPYGNVKELGKTMHVSVLLQKYYNELKGLAPFGGLYFFMNPTILATDLDFIKNVLIKDFNHFVSRGGVFSNPKDDPLSGHLFLIDGDKWKRLRTKLTPTFTSGKMKLMFPMILNVADELILTITSLINGIDGDIEVKEILARFTTDVIGTAAFGINCNSLRNENSEFRKYGRVHFEQPRNSFFKILFLNNFTELARQLKMKQIRDDVSEFFLGSLRETMRYREENNIQRNDFLNMMIQLQEHGNVEGEETNFVHSQKDKLTFYEIAAQCFAFFAAGFETSSSTIAFCLFELSVKPDVQQKARREVFDVLRKHNGQFTYEAMMEMNYVDRCIQGKLSDIYYCVDINKFIIN